MYFSYKCTYCGRQFYTYDANRENASKTLYRTVKNHLVEYNEDHKEHEMDDGEQADSNQIYSEMVESKEKPAGGYEANENTSLPSESHSSGSGTSYSSAATLIILLLLLIFIGFLFLFPGVLNFTKEHLPQP